MPLVPLKIKSHYYFHQIKTFIDDPAHAYGLVFISVVLISLLIFGFLIIGQNLFVTKTLKQRSLASERQIEQEQSREKAAQAQTQANFDQVRKTDLESIKVALEKFKQDNTFYPQTLENLTPKYLPFIPMDPETNDNYFYLPSVDQNNFELSTNLSTSTLELSGN